MAKENEGQKQPQKPEGAPKPPLQNVPPTGQKKTKSEGEAASPLMGKGTPPPQAGTPAEQGKPTMVGAQGQPTMVAGGTGQPTMVAGGTGQPTMIASQTGKPTMIGTQQGKPTMIAPEQAAQDAGAQPGAAAPTIQAGGQPTMTPPGAKPTMAPKPAAPTMLSKGAAGKTQLMPPEQQPYDLAPQTPGADPKATMLAKQAQKTQVAKSGQATTLAPPDKQGPMPLPEGAPQGTILAKDAAKATMLAKGGTPTTLAPPGEGPMPLPEGAPKGTVLSRDAAKATLLAKTGQPTSLAPADEQPLPLPPGSAKKTSMAPSGQPTTLAPPDEGPMDVPGSQKMTMLARSGELTTLAPPDEEPLATPGGSLAKKTSMAPTGQPTVLGPPDEEPLPTPGGNKRTMVAQTGSPTILVPEDTMAEDAGVAPPEMSAMDMGQTASGLLDSSTKYQVAPAEPKVKPKYGRRWLGGTILGILIGTAAVIGLGLFDLFGFSAPKEWKEALGLYKEPPTQAGEKTIAQKALELLDRGDFKEALAEAEKGDGSNAQIAWLRGEARWLLYVQQQDKAGKQISLKDGDASKAADELGRAKDKWARATLWLGKMEEKAGDTAKAKDIYEEGMKKFTSLAPMFESALDQMEAAPAKKKKDAGGAMRKMNEAEALAILMIAFQENAEAGKADEAGFDFWRSVKNANKHNYKEAISALDAAIKAHEKNRFQRLRKAQNPQSDPTEEIFLRAAAELRMYYQIRDRLNDAKLLADGRTPLQAVDAAILAAKDPGEQMKLLLATANTELGLNKDNPTVKDVMDGLKSAGKMVQGIAGIKEELVKGKYVDEDDPDYIKGMKELMKDAGNKQVVQNIQKRLEKADIKEDDADKGVGIAIKQRDDAYKLIDTSLKMLEENKYLAENSKREELPTGVERAIDAGRSPLVSALARAAAILGKTSSDAGLFGGDGLNLAKRLALAEGQVAVLNTRLRMVRTPRDMMDFWPVVLERKPPKEVNDAAALDARRVLDPSYGATPNDKGAAYTIQGMVRRNTGEFDAARDDLASALRSGKVAREGPWRPFALNTLRVLSDPNAYFIPQSDELAAAGKFPEALEVLKEGVGAFPKDGRLLAQRSLVEIDLAAQAALRARKKLNAKDDMVAQARKDANAAIASGALAEGNFAAGRVAEELGDAAAAEKHYRDAIKAHPANDRAGSRYRVALGRVLIQFQPPKLAPEPADGGIPMPNKVGRKAPPTDLERQIREAVAKQDAMALFVLLTVAALQPEDDLDADPGLDEAIRLGEAAIRAGNPEGYLIKGLALARKGQWTEALQTYTEGLRRLIKPDQAAGLFYIVDRHPAFQLPDSLRNPDLAVAEKHYANGLRAYFLGQYPQAEKELLEAYRNNGQDARILYYLGLARLGQQNKRDQAVVNFQMGALLERQQKPGSAAVGASLERVQGGPRRTLELYRP